MIYEIKLGTIELPYHDDGQLCLPHGLLNPASFRSEFKANPWYPFGDLAFTEEYVECIRKIVGAGTLYRMEMPCRGNIPRLYVIRDFTKIDTIKVHDWLAYDRGMLWSTTGMLVINDHSDVAVVSMSDEHSKAVFGMSLEDMYFGAESAFKDRCESDPDIAQFMVEIRRTWAIKN